MIDLTDEPHPLVSIIVPAYNAERFIEETLISAGSQSYPNIEILVVNDGSSDKTEIIVGRFASLDPRIKMITIANSGVASARNVGLHAATGKLVAFLDADDLWHPEKLSLQVAALDRAYADAVFTLHRRIDEWGNIIGDGTSVVYSGKVLARHFYFRSVSNGSAILVRKEAALAVGGYDRSYHAQGIGGCEDFDFELKIASKYSVTFVPQFLVGYRVYDGNMSSNYRRMADSMAAITDSHLANCGHFPSYAKRWILANSYRYSYANYRRARFYRKAVLTVLKIWFYDPPQLLRMVSRLAKKLTRAFIPARLRRRSVPVNSIAFSKADPNKQETWPQTDDLARQRLEQLKLVDERASTTKI